MNTKELAFAKHGALSAKNWDTFQAIIRKCLKRQAAIFTIPGYSSFT